MYSRKELEVQEKEIGKLRYVFLLVFLITILFAYFKDNSKDIENRYKEANKETFSGIVKDKESDGDCIHCPHYIYLNSWESHQINSFLYSRIEIGDSVVKKAKSDSVYYFKKNGEIIIDDQNRYLREKYTESLGRKKKP